tara:strand:+ start:22 stop:489 length:468 start_codon:yes stop_codon:yes gene_type:complete
MLLESKNISSEASQFIKNMVNESFLLPVTTKACHINHSSKVVFNHLNVEDCGEGSLRCFELSFTNGRAKQMRNNPPSLFPPGENKAWAIVDMLDKMYLVLRVLEEDSSYIVHFDKLIPIFLHGELREIAKDFGIYTLIKTIKLVEPDIEKNKYYG